MVGSTEPAACIFLHWASIVRALVLFVLGAVVQSQWTAWRSGKAEQVGKTAEERKRNQSRQYPARARPEPSTVTAHDLNIWSSFAACHYPKHREKTQRPTKMKIQEKGMETPERWESYAASHYKNKSQTICQERGLQRKSTVLFERTMSSDAAVTQGTSNFVRSRRNPVKPSHRNVAPTDVGSAGLPRSGSATSLLSLYSPERERCNPVKPLRQDETVTRWLRQHTTVIPTDVGSAGLQRSGSSTSLNSNFSVSSNSPDRERASGIHGRKKAKTVPRSSGTRFYADVVAKSRAEPQRIRRSVSF
jgi:hypothetical protein